MSDDYERLFREGTIHALRGEDPAAAAAFEACRRLRPDAVDPVVQLLECRQREGDLARADALAEELLRRWPEDEAAVLAAARLREEEGRAREALDLVRGGRVRLGPDGNAYPDLLRLLVGTGRFDEAALEARWAFQQDSLWKPDAILARALAQLHYGERDRAAATLAQLDLGEYADLVDFWADRLARGGGLAAVQRLADDAAAAQPGDRNLAALRDRLARRG